jgi:hypothetical protein
MKNQGCFGNTERWKDREIDLRKNSKSERQKTNRQKDRQKYIKEDRWIQRQIIRKTSRQDEKQTCFGKPEMLKDR